MLKGADDDTAMIPLVAASPLLYPWRFTTCTKWEEPTPPSAHVRTTLTTNLMDGGMKPHQLEIDA